MTAKYQGASSAYYHPTRKFPRPLRQGDRVKDTGALSFATWAEFSPDHHKSNYPGAHSFGTVTAGPANFIGDPATYVFVRFDDHYEAWTDVDYLTRL